MFRGSASLWFLAALLLAIAAGVGHGREALSVAGLYGLTFAAILLAVHGSIILEDARYHREHEGDE